MEEIGNKWVKRVRYLQMVTGKGGEGLGGKGREWEGMNS